MNALKNLKSKLARGRTERKGKNDTTQPIDEPMDFDILLGRGKTSFNHVGNRRFRVFIGLHLRRYMDAQSRMEKTLVVNSVVEAIQEAGGRFLKQDAKSKKWFQVNSKMAREKVGHALRDAVGIRMKMAAAGVVENQPGQPFVRRASEIAREKARRNSVTELPRPTSTLVPPGQITRFSKSCSDLKSNDQVAAVRSSMAISAQKAMLELQGELDEDGVAVPLGEGGSSELMFDPLTLPNMSPKSNSKTSDSDRDPTKGGSTVSNNSSSMNRKPDMMLSAPVLDETPKLSNSGRKGVQMVAGGPPPPPKILGPAYGGSPGTAENYRKTFDGGSAEFSVMSEATNKKWFDLGSGEFSVATVDSKVFDDNGDNDDGDGEGGSDPNLPKHLMDRVNKALTDLEVSGELTAKRNKGGGSGMYRKQNTKKSGKLQNSFVSDIDISEEFSIMSLDTRGKLEEDYGFKSEEFGLRPDEFARTAPGGGGLKSEEFNLRSEEFTRNNSVNGTTFEFDPHSSLVSAMRTSSTEFTLKTIEALRDSSPQNNADAMRNSGSSEFMMTIAKIADVGVRDSAGSGNISSASAASSGRQSSKQKITWNLDHDDSIQPKGLMMDTVLEGAALEEQNNASDALLINGSTVAGDAVVESDAATAASLAATLPEPDEDNAASTEFSVKSGDWNTALDYLAT